MQDQQIRKRLPLEREFVTYRSQVKGHTIPGVFLLTSSAFQGSTLHTATWGSISVGREGGRGNMTKSLYCGFCGKEQGKQGKQFKTDCFE